MKSKGYIRKNHPLAIRMMMIWRVLTKKNVMMVYTVKDKCSTAHIPHVTSRTNFNGQEEAYILNHVAVKMQEKYNSRNN